MGKALALTYLRRGEQVVVIGTNAQKGQALLDAATELDAGRRVEFIQADLSLLTENRRVIDQITSTHQAVDALVLGARYFRATRFVTAEGFEANFALFYLSRYLLGHGLVAQLDQADTPVILDLAGPGGDLSRIHCMGHKDVLGLRMGTGGEGAKFWLSVLIDCRAVEILALRRQLTVLQRQLGNQRPRLRPEDRALLAALLAQLSRMALRRLRLLVSPDTVLRWHRDLVKRRHAPCKRAP